MMDGREAIMDTDGCLQESAVWHLLGEVSIGHGAPDDRRMTCNIHGKHMNSAVVADSGR